MVDLSRSMFPPTASSIPVISKVSLPSLRMKEVSPSLEPSSNNMSPSLTPKSLSVSSPLREIRDALVRVVHSSLRKPLPNESSNNNPKRVEALPSKITPPFSSLTKDTTSLVSILAPIPEWLPQ